MSGSIQLPDEILDAVAGGTLSLNGETITGFDINDTHMTVTTASGTYRAPLGADEKADFAADPAGVISMFQQGMDHPQDFALEAGTFVKIA